MFIDKDLLPTKLLWIDLEMTGLDPSKDVIIEVAAEITDFSFTKLASFEAVIAQSEKALASMNEWAQAQHTASGLTERVRREGRPEREVQAELTELVTRHFGDEPAILAGNSIHQDRLFIRTWWPLLNERLHYRMLDVTSFKIIMEGKYGTPFEKKNSHRARGDIHESIAELQYYLKHFKKAT